MTFSTDYDIIIIENEKERIKMKDVRYGDINTTHFSFAKDDYLLATGQKDVNPKVFTFVAEQKDTADDWDKLIMMAADTCVNIIIIDINQIEDNKIGTLIDLLSDVGFIYNLKSYEDHLCFTCDKIKNKVDFFRRL